MDILKFLNDNKDALGFLFGSGIVVAALAAIVRFAVLIIRRYSGNRKRVDTKPFKIIPPRSDVAREILGGADDDPLADRNIPYQARVTGRHVRHELEHQLEESHWLLILAPTGVGKTREALNLLQTLNQEGWTILFLTREQWLDAPANKPADMPDRKVVFFLDDLNRKCYASRVEQAPRAGEVLQPLTMPLQERLHRALKVYAAFCGGMEEVRIVATARDETEPEMTGEPSPWDMLQFEKYADLWKRFMIYRLPLPDDVASVKAFQDTATQARIEINADAMALARRNDRTFANIVENLKIARVEQTSLTLENFRDTLKGTWQRRYQTAIRKHAAARYVYDAIELLRVLGIVLEPFIVEPTARLLADGRWLQRWRHRWQIRAALRYLISAESILSPCDGQIEAKGTSIDVHRYLVSLQSLLLRLADRRGITLLDALLRLAAELSKSGRFVELVKLLGQVVRLDPNLAPIYNFRGVTYAALKNYEAALADFSRAIELDPNNAQAYNFRGNTYVYLNNYEAALADYTHAIDLDPNDATAYNRRGFIYAALKNNEAALADISRALELDPNLFQALDYRSLTNRPQ